MSGPLPSVAERIARLRELLDQVDAVLASEVPQRPAGQAEHDRRVIQLTTEVAEEAAGLAVAFLGPAPAVFWAPLDGHPAAVVTTVACGEETP